MLVGVNQMYERVSMAKTIAMTRKPIFDIPLFPESSFALRLDALSSS